MIKYVLAVSLVASASSTIVGNCWTLIEGSFKHASVGPSGVFAVNASDAIFYRTDTAKVDGSTGTDWVQLDGRLKQIDVGTNVIWGVDSTDHIYFRKHMTTSNPYGTGWHRLDGGTLKHVSVSNKGHVWGANPRDYVYRRPGANNNNQLGNTWQEIDGRLSQVSVGESGVWGVDAVNRVFYREGTYGDVDTAGSGWTQVTGKLLKYISSGNDNVYGVDSSNDIYKRLGITASNPTGTHWQQIQGKLKEVEVHGASIWGCNPGDDIYTKQA